LGWSISSGMRYGNGGRVRVHRSQRLITKTEGRGAYDGILIASSRDYGEQV